MTKADPDKKRCLQGTHRQIVRFLTERGANDGGTIASALGMKFPPVSKALQHLESKGYVVKGEIRTNSFKRMVTTYIAVYTDQGIKIERANPRELRTEIRDGVKITICPPAVADGAYLGLRIGERRSYSRTGR